MFHPQFTLFDGPKFHTPNKSATTEMAPHILQWTRENCVDFLRKCERRYAAIFTEGELQICITNFVQNHVAGSTLLSFSDDEWMALIPSMGFRRFIRMELSAQERFANKIFVLQHGVASRKHQ